MKQERWVVSEDDERPNRPDSTCFYCHAKIGAEHAAGCVIRTRSVVVTFKVTGVLRVPEDWDAEYVRSHYARGSWCGNNLVQYIENLADSKAALGAGCLCAPSGQLDLEFVREATTEDEKTLGEF